VSIFFAVIATVIGKRTGLIPSLAFLSRKDRMPGGLTSSRKKTRDAQTKNPGTKTTGTPGLTANQIQGCPGLCCSRREVARIEFCFFLASWRLGGSSFIPPARGVRIGGSASFGRPG
jgi:hypothetical protein